MGKRDPIYTQKKLNIEDLPAGLLSVPHRGPSLPMAEMTIILFADISHTCKEHINKRRRRAEMINIVR